MLEAQAAVAVVAIMLLQTVLRLVNLTVPSHLQTLLALAVLFQQHPMVQMEFLLLQMMELVVVAVAAV